jgi:hypothetical protein
MTQLSLPEKVLAIHRRLDEASVAHAFGGALALAYYAEPRSTIDIDINVFLDPSRHPEVQNELAVLGVGNDVSQDVVERDGQCRIWWGTTPLDLFYAYHDFHEAMSKATRRQPFASETIPVLAPEHLVTFKAIFNRPKDWLDIEQVLAGVPDLNRAEIDDWLDQTLGADDPRALRFKELSGALPDRST